MNWRTNSPTTHPPYQTECIIRTRDGEEHPAMLIHLNPRYHKKVRSLDKWRLGKHKYVEDEQVVEWRFDIDI